MNDADFDKWQAWLTGFTERRAAESVRAALTNSKPDPPGGCTSVIRSSLVLHVVCQDDCDASLYHRYYDTVEAAVRGVIAEPRRIHGSYGSRFS